MQLLRHRQLARHFIGDIQDHPDTQPLQHLEQLAPLHGFPAALDLAHEGLADTDAAGGIVLANGLGLAAGPHHGANIVGGIEFDAHSEIPVLARISDKRRDNLPIILVIARISW
ncbi:hypothetical protein ACE0DR_01915 [Azotobacter sp. CWF10]